MAGTTHQGSVRFENESKPLQITVPDARPQSVLPQIMLATRYAPDQLPGRVQDLFPKGTIDDSLKGRWLWKASTESVSCHTDGNPVDLVRHAEQLPEEAQAAYIQCLLTHREVLKANGALTVKHLLSYLGPVIDLSSYDCPFSLLQTQGAIEEHQRGAQLSLVYTDPANAVEAEDWLEREGIRCVREMTSGPEILIRCTGEWSTKVRLRINGTPARFEVVNGNIAAIHGRIASSTGYRSLWTMSPTAYSPQMAADLAHHFYRKSSTKAYATEFLKKDYSGKLRIRLVSSLEGLASDCPVSHLLLDLGFTQDGFERTNRYFVVPEALKNQAAKLRRALAPLKQKGSRLADPEELASEVHANAVKAGLFETAIQPSLPGLAARGPSL